MIRGFERHIRHWKRSWQSCRNSNGRLRKPWPFISKWQPPRYLCGAGSTGRWRQGHCAAFYNYANASTMKQMFLLQTKCQGVRSCRQTAATVTHLTLGETCQFFKALIWLLEIHLVTCSFDLNDIGLVALRLLLLYESKGGWIVDVNILVESIHLQDGCVLQFHWQISTCHVLMKMIDFQKK